MPRACILALTTLIASCSIGSSEPECTHRDIQVASARAFYPDTGINAGTAVFLAFSQRDPHYNGEEAHVGVSHVWPAARGLHPEPAPRVRLVRDDGRVLLDTLAWHSIQHTSWIVNHIVRDAELRNTMFQAIKTETLWIELWMRHDVQPAIRLRPHTESAEVLPVPPCT